MKVSYRVLEKSGIMGGRSYITEIRVQLEKDEQDILDSYGARTSFDVGERFKDRNGVDLLGGMRLESLTRGLEAKFNTIQLADDFALKVVEGLKSVKRQIELTRESVSRLNQMFELTI
jgi:hypothetical protein